MKVLVFVIFAFLSANGLEVGKYRPNQEDGRYYPDDEGQYIPDYRGRYIHDPSGNYKHDGTGLYSDYFKGRRNINTIPEESRQNKRIEKPLRSEYKIVRQVGDDLNLNGYHWKYDTSGKIINTQNSLDGTFNLKDFDGKGLFRYNGPHNIVYSIIYSDI